MKKAVLFLVGSFIIFQLALADNSLYQATVSVASQSQQDLQTGISQAFSQVLVKVAGNDKVLTSRKIKDQLGQAAAGYVQSYSYTNANTSGNPSDLNNLATKIQPMLMLQVQFYPKAVDELLQGANIKSWAKQQRPLMLILLATQTGQGKILISNNSTDNITTALQNNANNRGLPILLPMMDLQDMQNIGVNDVWQLDTQNALRTAQRYGTQNILEAKIYITPDQQWNAQWVVINNGQNTSGKAQGNDANQVIAQMFNKITDNIAAKSISASAAPAQQVTLRINNVNGLDDYADIEKYLRSLATVSDVQVVNIDTSDLVLNVTVSGGATALVAALNGSTQLQSLPPATPGDNALNYRWNTTTSTATTNTNNNNPNETNTTTTTVSSAEVNLDPPQ